MSGKSRKDYTEPTVSKQCVFLLLQLQEVANFVVCTGFFSFFMLPLSILRLLLCIQHPPLYIIDTRHYIWPVFLLSFPSFPCLFCCFSSLISPSLILSSLNTSNILIYLPNCSLSHLHPVSENPIKNTPAGYQPITGSRFVSGTPHFLLFQSFLSSLNSSAQPWSSETSLQCPKKLERVCFCCYVCFMEYNKMRDVNRKYAIEIALPEIRQHYFFTTAEHVCRKVCH